jgi:hypothetical protein
VPVLLSQGLLIYEANMPHERIHVHPTPIEMHHYSAFSAAGPNHANSQAAFCWRAEFSLTRSSSGQRHARILLLQKTG